MVNQVRVPDVTKPPKKGRKWLKRIALFLGILLLIPILAIVLLPLYSSLFIPLVDSSIEAITGRKTEMKSLSINLLASKVSLQDFLIREKDTADDFLRVDKVDIDFSLMPLVSGNVTVPKFEVSGVYLKVKRDHTGKFNFQSIQEKVAESQPTVTDERPRPTPHPGKKEPMKLPHILAKIIIANINLLVEDTVEKSRFEIKNFNFLCDINGLEKIEYKSHWDKAQFEREGEKTQSAGLLYKLEGNASLTMQDNKPSLLAKGELILSEIFAKGFGTKDVTLQPVRFYHDINLDMVKGILEGKAGISTDYFALSLLNLKITELDKLQSQFSQPMDQKDHAKIQAMLASLPIEGWQGTIEGFLDLNKLQQDFGAEIRRASEEKLTEIGGRFELNAALEGKKEGVLEFKQNFSGKDFFLKGQMPQKEQAAGMKPYHISLPTIQEKALVKAALKERSLFLGVKAQILAQGNAQLLTLDEQAQLEKLWEATPPQVSQFEDKILLDLDVLNQVLRDLMPSDTQIKGKIQNQDSLTFKLAEGLKLTGSTNILAQLLSPQTRNLPPLQIEGERDLIVTVDQKYKVQEIKLNKFTLKTTANQLLSLSGKGAIAMESQQDQNIDLALKMILDELQPYIQAVMPEMKIKGNLDHKMRITKKEKNDLQVQGKGQLTGFAFSMTRPEESLNATIDEAKWNQNILLSQEDESAKIQIKEISFQNPAASLKMTGEITQNKVAEEQFEQKVDLKIEVPKIDLPKLQSMVVTKSTKPAASAPEVKEAPQAPQPAPEDHTKPFLTFSEKQQADLKKNGLHVEVLLKEIILDAQNKISDLNTVVSLNDKEANNEFHMKTTGKANEGPIEMTGFINFNETHPNFQFAYRLQQIPYVVSLFDPITKKMQAILPLPLLKTVQFDPATVRFGLKGDVRWLGMDPRELKKSLLGGKHEIQISQGKFDLGLDPAKFLNIADLQKQMESQLAPMRDSLKLLQGQKATQEGLMKSTQDQLNAIVNTIKEIEAKKQAVIGKLPAFLKKQAEEAAKPFTAQIQAQQQQKSLLEAKLAPLQAELSKMQTQITDAEAKLKAAEEDLKKKMKFDNPFAFSFDSATLSFQFENEKPWDKQGTVQEWIPFSFSKITDITVSFEPAQKDFLKIKGWFSFDGKYHLQIIPSSASLEDMKGKIPVIGQELQSQGGIVWTHEGMKPNLLGK